MNLRTALLAAALTASVTGLASAQSMTSASIGPGLYFSVGAGWNKLKDTDLSNVSATPFGSTVVDLSFNGGWIGQGAIGYRMPLNMLGDDVGRIEIEGAHRRNSGDDGFLRATGTNINLDGSVSQTSAMVNFLYEINTGRGLIPQIGFGAGAVNQSINSLKNAASGPAGTRVDDSTWNPAVQAIAGLYYAFNQNVSMGVRYVYFHGLGGVDGLDTRTPPATVFPDSKIDGLRNHSVLLSLRYDLGGPRRPAPQPAAVVAPSPPPPPPPAAAIQRTFLVFFDFDKSDITPEADRVITQASQNAKTAAVTRIVLTGHTDRAGSVAYNQALSIRRGEAVSRRLVQNGIPANQISVIGRGETQPLVPTADGVREPQNRRVEIVLQ